MAGATNTRCKELHYFLAYPIVSFRVSTPKVTVSSRSGCYTFKKEEALLLPRLEKDDNLYITRLEIIGSIEKMLNTNNN